MTVDLDRLAGAVRRCRLSLKGYREERRAAIQHYAGRHWGAETNESDRVASPVNLLSLYVSVVGRALIPKNPRLLLTTFDKSAKSAVSAAQDWANEEVARTYLADSLRRVVIDGLFDIGILKVALAGPGDAATAGWNKTAGEPFCDRVDLDDFCADMHCRDFREADFIGHRYRVPLEAAQALYGARVKDLAPAQDRLFNLEGDERVGAMGRGAIAGEEFEEKADLWEIYLPRTRRVLTLDNDFSEILQEREWLGPDCGPYHLLCYQVVPGSPMPKGPLTDLIDLHVYVNQIYRKLFRQAQRQKSVLPVRGAATDDAGRIQQASDGEMCQAENAAEIKEVRFGGPDQQMILFGDHLKQLFAYMAGNLDMMGGLSPQSKTATQDKMLEENASRAINDLQEQTVNFTEGVARGLLWYWWHHPSQQMKSVLSLPGAAGVSTVRSVPPERRAETPYADLTVKVDPYSLQAQTPAGRVGTIIQILGQIQPFMPLMAQQGVYPDMTALVNILAKYVDMPELLEILTVLQPPEEGAAGPKGSGMPVQTDRTYTRQSMPGRTEKGNSMMLMNSLSGVDGGGDPEGGA